MPNNGPQSWKPNAWETPSEYDLELDRQNKASALVSDTISAASPGRGGGRMPVPQSPYSGPSGPQKVNPASRNGLMGGKPAPQSLQAPQWKPKMPGPGPQSTPQQPGGQPRGRQDPAYWQAQLDQLFQNKSFVNPGADNAWGSGDWMSHYSVDDDVTADGGNQWMRNIQTGSRAKLKAGVDPDIAQALSGYDPSEWGQRLQQAGVNPADYLEEEEYSRDMGAMEVPDAWKGEIEGWDPQFQQAWYQAYQAGDERASQQIRNMARAAAFAQWQPQPQAAPVTAPQPQPSAPPQQVGRVTPPNVPVLDVPLAWLDPNNPYY